MTRSSGASPAASSLVSPASSPGAPASSPGFGLAPWQVLFLACASALSVANLYYNQPLLALMAHDLQVSPKTIGWVPVLTQSGYALAMLFVVPWGDAVERRACAVTVSLAVAATLAITSVVSSAFSLIAMSLMIGFSSAGAQILIPLAARLTAAHERGRVVGLILGGVLVGVLLARVLAGQVGALWGWRAMYRLAAVWMLVLAGLLRLLLPRVPAVEALSPRTMFASLQALVVQHATLREATFTGACLFASFCAFWSTLVFHVQSAFGMDSRAAGWFGVVGLVGALAAPLAGRFSDGGSPRQGVRLGVACALAGFVCMGLWGHSLLVLVAGVVVMDLGVQAALASNQARIYALSPQAPSRVNTVFMVGYFCGGSLGSALASVAWHHAAWPGVCGLACAVLLLAWFALMRREPVEGGPLEAVANPGPDRRLS